jgi:hypothetical protein
VERWNSISQKLCKLLRDFVLALPPTLRCLVPEPGAEEWQMENATQRASYHSLCTGYRTDIVVIIIFYSSTRVCSDWLIGLFAWCCIFSFQVSTSLLFMTLLLLEERVFLIHSWVCSDWTVRYSYGCVDVAVVAFSVFRCQSLFLAARVF